jgi:putative FmdB family regulatory protein
MPIYEYSRPDGSTFEIVQSFSDDTLTHDPDTGVPVQRVLHAPAVHFKGKGFYNTDYGTRKRQRENAAASSAESSAKKDSDGAAAGSDKGSAGSDKGSAGADGKPTGEKPASAGGKAKDAKPVAAKS